MYVGLLDNRRERPLGLPTRLQKRGEVARVPHPWHLQLHRPYPRVPGALPVAVALSHPLGAPLVRCGTHMLFYLHLHERLGEHPNTLLEEIRVLIDHRLAQQLREPYPQFIGHRAFSFGRLVSSEGTTRWPSSSTAFASYTLARTLPIRSKKGYLKLATHRFPTSATKLASSTQKGAILRLLGRFTRSRLAVLSTPCPVLLRVRIGEGYFGP